MKLPETDLKKKKYSAVMLFSFLYGGFSLILFMLVVYSAIWATEIADLPFVGGPVGIAPEPGGRIFRISEGLDFNRTMDSNVTFTDENAVGRFNHINRNPLAIVLSPAAMFLLIGGLISISAGLTISSLTRQKEIKAIKKEVASNMLLPDEKAIVEVLKNSNFESTQAKLARETGLNKVQVHRAIKRLESKGVLEKHDYGLTNKIILKKEFFE
jgi:hypothetical protein